MSVELTNQSRGMGGAIDSSKKRSKMAILFFVFNYNGGVVINDDKK